MIWPLAPTATDLIGESPSPSTTLDIACHHRARADFGDGWRTGRRIGRGGVARMFAPALPTSGAGKLARRRTCRVSLRWRSAERDLAMWANRFEEDVADLFKLQDRVVARLANALNHELMRAESETGEPTPKTQTSSTSSCAATMRFGGSRRTTSSPFEPCSNRRSKSTQMTPMRSGRLFNDVGVSGDRRGDGVSGREQSGPGSIMTRATNLGSRTAAIPASRSVHRTSFHYRRVD
jgi:hypothetical protein